MGKRTTGSLNSSDSILWHLKPLLGKMKNMKTFKLLILMLCFLNFGYAWEDHADVQDHRETDRIFNLAQKQTGTDKYENMTDQEKAIYNEKWGNGDEVK